MRWLLLLIGLEFPATIALLDCINRDPEYFVGGAADRDAWLRWLIVSLLLCPVLVGYGILLGYHWNVVKRSSPLRP